MIHYTALKRPPSPLMVKAECSFMLVSHRPLANDTWHSQNIVPSSAKNSSIATRRACTHTFCCHTKFRRKCFAQHCLVCEIGCRHTFHVLSREDILRSASSPHAFRCGSHAPSLRQPHDPLPPSRRSAQ